MLVSTMSNGKQQGEAKIELRGEKPGGELTAEVRDVKLEKQEKHGTTNSARTEVSSQCFAEDRNDHI